MGDDRSLDGATLVVADDDLCRLLRRIAHESGRPVESLVAEALWDWVNREHEQEDLAALDAAQDSPVAPWEAVRKRLKPERLGRRGA